MAAGFTIKKNDLEILDDFIQRDYSNKILTSDNVYNFEHNDLWYFLFFHQNLKN